MVLNCNTVWGPSMGASESVLIREASPWGSLHYGRLAIITHITWAIGKSAFTYKMQSFVYGVALAGLAGGLFALYTRCRSIAATSSG